MGLIATDGSLSKDGRHIILRSSDIDLLETFKRCLKLKDKIGQSYNNGYAKKPSFRVQFSNVKFYRWLMTIGLFPAKTYTLGKIEVPDQFLRDFLRGHLDGDGSIYTYIDRYNFYRGRNYVNQRVYVKFISASEVHIKWLFKKINSIIGIRCSLQCHKSTSENRVPMWEIKFSKRESIKLLNWIYYKENLPCLLRKKELARRIIKFVGNEKRKEYSRIVT